ncbi:hypothetical protein ACJ41O_002124 [Fusarium nematophilum]
MSNRERSFYTRSVYEDAPEVPSYHRGDIHHHSGRHARPYSAYVPRARHGQASWEDAPPSPFTPPCCGRGSQFPVSDGESSEASLPFQEAQSYQAESPGDRLPPRIAFEQLSQCINDALRFYKTCLSDFRRENQRRGYDTSSDSLCQWLWREWTSERDARTRERFSSIGTTISLQLGHVEAAIAAPWPGELAKERFEHSMRMLRMLCSEVIRLAARAKEDLQACRLLLDELRIAGDYADPDSRMSRVMFSG